MAIGTSTKLANPEVYTVLVESVTSYFRQNRRTMPWRDDLSDNREQRFYQVLVSEMMLQQTQVSRVLPKYDAWMRQYPTMYDAAAASLGEVLMIWQGLGYNRRAKWLYESLKYFCDSGIPGNLLDVQQLAGIGPNTAAAIKVYVDDKPEVFIETNIRTVVLEHVFESQQNVNDDAIRCVVAAILPKKQVREWYWALMDYGSYLKSQKRSHLHRAASHKPQKPFSGSPRQLRGHVLRHLAQNGPVEYDEVMAVLDDARTQRVVEQLLHEGLVERYATRLALPGSHTVQ